MSLLLFKAINAQNRTLLLMSMHTQEYLSSEPIWQASKEKLD